MRRRDPEVQRRRLRLLWVFAQAGEAGCSATVARRRIGAGIASAQDPWRLARAGVIEGANDGRPRLWRATEAGRAVLEAAIRQRHGGDA